MTSTITPGVVEHQDQSPRRNRGLLTTVAVLAVMVIGLGIALVALVARDDDGTAVPDDVQAVLDEYLVATNAHDYAAMKTLVTSNFRRPFYQGEALGGANPYRAVWTIEDYDFMEDEEPLYKIERIGDPIVRGDGPWYVSIAENWENPETTIQYEAIYTYVVVVDTDDVLRIDDAYWAGQAALAESN